MTQSKQDKNTARQAATDCEPAETNGDPRESQRKERVLHTRVPAVLEQELKNLAQSLRMPVSNVVRAILEDAVSAVDVVGRKAEGEMNRVVDRIAEKREKLRNIATGGREGSEEVSREETGSVGEPKETAQENLLNGIIGYQPLVLAAQATCSVCSKELRSGSTAYVGLRDDPGPRVMVGPECLPDHKEVEL
ncbi:MAG: hypothetical protein CSA75_01700 [Sorangium cellulosum]|nr:MAG: hypothetical protein CSA75_01700 [Sorangium cellulosum]